jgi:glutathione S-transferase
VKQGTVLSLFLLDVEQPLGQVPVLDVDGVKIPQSYAIARFVAREAKLAGRNNIEQAQADAVIDSIVDLNNAFDRVYESEDEAVIVNNFRWVFSLFFDFTIN